MSRADDELVARAKQGDADAWRALYRAHAGRLLVWLSTRPTGDSAVSPEDLAAEAWLTAAAKVDEFHGTAQEFAGWLFGIARHLSLNLHRRSARRRTDPGAEEQTSESQHQDGPETYFVGKEWVRQALAQLPPRERDVVGCLDVVGLDVESTARALDISAVAVRVARHRGLRRLREWQPTDQPTDQSAGQSPGSAGASASSASR